MQIGGGGEGGTPPCLNRGPGRYDPDRDSRQQDIFRGVVICSRFGEVELEGPERGGAVAGLVIERSTGLVINMTDDTACGLKKNEKLVSTISDSDHISYVPAQWSSDQGLSHALALCKF